MFCIAEHWILLCVIFQSEILLITSANKYEHCPDLVQKSRYHVATHNRTCYLFVNRERYWDDARDDCWKMGGEMLVIPNEATMRFLINELNSRKLGWSNNGVWNGANDIDRTGWEWTTGEKLRYTYWASGEPGNFLNAFSFENCACMRRNDGWKWHDYMCDSMGFKYNYICQFGFMEYKASPSETLTNEDNGSPLTKKDDFVTVLALAVGGVILLALMTAITYYLYKKHEYQKAEAERPVVRFQNAGYATIMQDVTRNTSNGNNGSSRPASNLYFDPSEVTRIYDEVNKETNHGVNSLGTTEAAHLLHTSGATNMDDMANGYISAVPSEVSAATSGYCSSTTEPKQGESEYVEMNGASLDQVEYENGSINNSSVSNNQPVKGNNVGKDINDLKPVKPGADGVDGPTHGDRQTNEYVQPTMCKRESELKQNNDCVRKEGQDDVEIHMYTNSLEVMDSQKGRPLPPVPVNDYEIPINS